MKIMVIGGGGFIGSKLVDKLILEGFNVVNVSKEKGNKKATNYKLDIRDNSKLRSIFKEEKPDIVINESGIVYWDEKDKDPCKDVETTIVGSLNLLKNCIECRVKKFIFASSISVYGYPPNKVCVDEEDKIDFACIPDTLFSYALAKYMAEQYIQFYNKKDGLNYTILRYAHVYGPGQINQKDVISSFIDKLIDNKPLTVTGEGNQIRDYVYIEDVICATILAIEKGNNEIINIGCGKPISVNDLISAFKEVLGKEIKIEKVKPRSVLGGVYMDISRAKKELSWIPKTSLYEGLSNTMQFFKKEI